MILTCVIRSYVGMPSIMREVDECHATKNFDFANYFGFYKARYVLFLPILLLKEAFCGFQAGEEIIKLYDPR